MGCHLQIISIHIGIAWCVQYKTFLRPQLIPYQDKLEGVQLSVTSTLVLFLQATPGTYWAPLEQCPALPTNIGLGRNGLTVTNTPAY